MRKFIIIILASIIIPLLLYTFLPVQLFYMSDTGSMIPVLDHQDRILVYTGVDYTELERGDIITYKSKCVTRNYVTHQVIDTTDEGLITNGVNNDILEKDQELACSDPITSEELVGKVIYKYDK